MNKLQKLTSNVSRIDDALGFGHAVLDDLKDTISIKSEEKNRRIIRVDGRRTVSLPISTLNCIKC
jgi:hypothetical protein